MRGVSAFQGAVQIIEVPDPTPKASELLVRVEAAGINGGDWKLERDTQPELEPSLIPGHEMAGTVVAAGSDTRRFSVGDRVTGIVAFGQAELAVIPESLALPVPDSVSMVEAGGFSEVFCTAHDALFTQCGLGPGDRLLVTGAGGGIGTAAVQLAHSVGATVVASARDQSKHAGLAELGAIPALPADAHGHGPFDVILELVGGQELQAHIESLADGGHISLVGLSRKTEVTLPMTAFKRNCGQMHWSRVRQLPLADKARIAARVEHSVLPLLAAGRVRVLVDSVFDMNDAKAAYERFRGGSKLGKVILTFGSTEA